MKALHGKEVGRSGQACGGRYKCHGRVGYICWDDPSLRPRSCVDCVRLSQLDGKAPSA